MLVVEVVKAVEEPRMMITRYLIGLCIEYNPFTPCAARPDV